ncbi:MAG: TIGR03087 family PEP-CTERM/XrtA system glycosyltransferase [Acetobacteraceae bacterium]|nr:TIGR03087 family PEP-CTERM/XrtA system glycosyltransferase [Acetobacteraceae bacterium]
MSASAILPAATARPGARGRLLFLAHRIPYPPMKGEKIRAYHQLRHLGREWTVDLGCVVDQPEDLRHLPALRELCAELCAPYLRAGWRGAARALARARPGAPLTLGWFHAPILARWVRDGLAAGRWDAAFVYSSALAPLLMGTKLPRILDLVDVDSAKWAAYAEEGGRFPMRAVWRREARTLLAFERQAALDFDRTLFVSEQEAAHFAALAPEAAARLDHVDNGVELSRFDPAGTYANPYGAAPVLVFTGTMDYRPNMDAVAWFAREVMPLLRGRQPAPEFWIVGANPAPAVLALAALPGIRVTGPVPDIRPYIAHAAAAVAPLRIARGIQNKVLEAMAMARPVIASPQAFEGVRASPGRDLLVADTATAMAARIAEVLDGAHGGIGERARQAVMATHDWGATLARLDTALAAVLPR